MASPVSKSPQVKKPGFNVVEASISDLKKALDTGVTTSVELVVAYLHRIGIYDISNTQLNAFTLLNPSVLKEARESDLRRASGLPARALEGIPYTLKDSYKYTSLTVAAGSPAFVDLLSNEDSYTAHLLRSAGAVLIGKTNMPPLAAGGMQRGHFGRAESPYNAEFLTAAYASGSSNGAATSTAASFAAFALGSETVSSGRSPASNNALVCYTPSRGVVSCRGLWPLYPTCDVVVPYTRSVADLRLVLEVLTQKDPEKVGDFWREQPFVALPEPEFAWGSLRPASLKGKRVGVPKAYVGHEDGKPTFVSPGVLALWEGARKDLEGLGAEVVTVDFPVVTKYEDDSVSGIVNNVAGFPDDWNSVERGLMVAKGWDKFLMEAGVETGLKDVDGQKLFPKHADNMTEYFLEGRNMMNYPNLVTLAQENPGSLWEIPGIGEALKALEQMRKEVFEDWLEAEKLDFVAFPAAGDVGRADLEENMESARHGMLNGVRYSNGNRVLRHLGLPTVSVPMGALDTDMPVNITFAGKAYEDDQLVQWAWAFEEATKRRTVPRLVPVSERPVGGGNFLATLKDGKVYVTGEAEAFVNGVPAELVPVGDGFEVVVDQKALPKAPLVCPFGREEGPETMILLTGREKEGQVAAELFLLPREKL
ncbi:hypothetical protein BP6252_06340 [Coleophoma cylindrospora]|uniref:Amidase domain-containing protein n=1 Tax=Coleophoma cylindrospora TaxID=1849047 RepID=A0A3D8RMM6_9HELO|nr:hypothetical protein BP6252_06340 [Coleophoma cylindrospora]